MLSSLTAHIKSWETQQEKSDEQENFEHETTAERETQGSEIALERDQQRDTIQAEDGSGEPTVQLPPTEGPAPSVDAAVVERARQAVSGLNGTTEEDLPKGAQIKDWI